jgi:hypothetical protein
MRRHPTLVLTVVLCVLEARPVRADCCNDFLSCAAAVLSGGVSCAVSAAVDELGAVKKRAEETRAAAQAERDRLLAIMQQETQRRTADAEAESAAKLRAVAAELSSTLEMQQAASRPARTAPGTHRQIVQPVTAQPQPTLKLVSPGIVAQSAPRPASEGDIKSESDRALARLRELKAEAAAAHTKFAQQEVNALRRTARAAITGMRAAFEASLLAPLLGLLGSLPPPDPLLTAAIVAGVAAELDRIEREGNAAIVRKASEADAAIKADADKMAERLAEQAQRQELASRIASLTERLLESKSQADLDALRAALSEGQIQRVQPMSEAPFVAGNLRLPGPRATGVIRLAPQATLNAVPAVPPAQLSQYDARAKSELARALAAPTAAATEKKKSALIAEARKRYAKDPALRDKLVAYIQSGGTAP